MAGTQRGTSKDEAERGKRATFNRKTGEVSGSGSGIGKPDATEDYDEITVGSGSRPRKGEPSNAA